MLHWSDEDRVHIPKLDRQHKRILGTIEELYQLDQSLERSELQVRLARVFGRLSRYIEEHFRDEEAMMLAAGYPGYQEQKREHAAFVDEVCNHHREFLKSRPVVTINLFNYLWDWFVNHVRCLDKKYEPFLGRRSRH